MPLASGNPQSIKRLGWRQGSVVAEVLASSLLEKGKIPNLDPDADLIIIVSHNCDVTSVSYVAEPAVEIVVAKPVATSDGNLSHGKNPRRLQFTLEARTSPQVYEVCIHSRTTIARQSLELQSPSVDVVIDQDNLMCLVNWLVQRYKRSAFPDAFNDRCRTHRKAIEKVLKKHGADLSGIYINLDVWHEIDEGDDYRVNLVATARQSVFDDMERNGPAYSAVEEIENALNECDGIEVVEAQLVSEADFSLKDLRQVQKWTWDHLSLREEDGGERPPYP